MRRNHARHQFGAGFLFCAESGEEVSVVTHKVMRMERWTVVKEENGAKEDKKTEKETFVGRVKRFAKGALRFTKASLKIQSLRPLL